LLNFDFEDNANDFLNEEVTEVRANISIFKCLFSFFIGITS